MWFVGVDPGSSGAIAIIDEFGAYVADLKLKDQTPHDVWEWLDTRTAEASKLSAAIERVHSMPKQGVASSFKFGFSAGFLHGMLVAAGIPFDDVTPQKWQKELSCLTRGDKNISKTAAQRRWPEVRITHANADALLIAEWRRTQWTATQRAPQVEQFEQQCR